MIVNNGFYVGCKFTTFDIEQRNFGARIYIEGLFCKALILSLNLSVQPCAVLVRLQLALQP